MTDVLIVGAGPVGLLLAGLLGKRGHSVLVLDKTLRRTSGSNAIGISPPSLQILASLNLDQSLALWGASIRRVQVHGPRQSVLGEVNFPEPILAVPQSVTELLLEQRLLDYTNVRLEYGWEYETMDQDEVSVTSFFHDSSGNPRCERSQFLVGCDGVKSVVRDSIELKYVPKKYDSTFLMGDYADTTAWGNEAHLFFTPRGAVESFPLGQGKRRWIVQTPRFLEQPGSYLEEEVRARTGFDLPVDTCSWKNPFGVHRWVSPHYAWGRVYLAGDSAHQMSPIGGQGMNTGFADAEFLSALLDARLAHPSLEKAEIWNAHYSRIRRKAARAAAARAELSMALGTVRGPLSALRNVFLSLLLRCLPHHLPRHYAMLTIPGHRLAQAKSRHAAALADLKE